MLNKFVHTTIGSSTVTLRPTIGTGDTEKTKTPTVAPSRLRSSSAPTKIPTFNPTAFPTRFPTPVKRIISVQCKTGNRLDACVFTYSDGDRVTYGDEAGGNWQRKYSLGANEYIKSVEWIDYKRHFGSAITFRTNVGRTFPYAGTDSPSASGEPFGPKNGCEVSALNVVNTNGKYTLDSVDFREVT